MHKCRREERRKSGVEERKEWWFPGGLVSQMDWNEMDTHFLKLSPALCCAHIRVKIGGI